MVARQLAALLWVQAEPWRLVAQVADQMEERPLVALLSVPMARRQVSREFPQQVNIPVLQRCEAITVIGERTAQVGIRTIPPLGTLRLGERPPHGRPRHGQPSALG